MAGSTKAVYHPSHEFDYSFHLAIYQWLIQRAGKVAMARSMEVKIVHAGRPIFMMSKNGKHRKFWPSFVRVRTKMHLYSFKRASVPKRSGHLL